MERGSSGGCSCRSGRAPQRLPLPFSHSCLDIDSPHPLAKNFNLVIYLLNYCKAPLASAIRKSIDEAANTTQREGFSKLSGSRLVGQRQAYAHLEMTGVARRQRANSTLSLFHSVCRRPEVFRNDFYNVQAPCSYQGQEYLSTCNPSAHFVSNKCTPTSTRNIYLPVKL